VRLEVNAGPGRRPRTGLLRPRLVRPKHGLLLLPDGVAGRRVSCSSRSPTPSAAACSWTNAARSWSSWLRDGDRLRHGAPCCMLLGYLARCCARRASASDEPRCWDSSTWRAA